VSEKREAPSGRISARRVTEEAGRGEETHQRILESAVRLVHRDGLPALTVAAVAAEAGVYKAAVSYHFGGKAGLMASLVTASFDEIDERIVAAARTRPPGRERVRFIVENWLDFVSPSNDLVFFDVLGYVLRKKEMRVQLQEFYQRWTDSILDLLQEGTETQSEPSRALALVLRMLIDGMTVERLIYPDRDAWKTAGSGIEQLTALCSGVSDQQATAD
jgi:AcrR family transcriptional regulator